jgi:exodeoxyribonuclease VII large subunit
VTRRLADQRARLGRAVSSIIGRAAQRTDVASDSLVRAWERGRVKRSERYNALERRLIAQNPSRRLERRVTQLTALRSRLDRSAERLVARRTGALAQLQNRLAAIDPLTPLERGYAIVTREGRPLRDAREAARGDEIEARLFVGSLTARVETVREDG